MRTTAAVISVLSTVIVLSACARHRAVIEPAPAVAPVPQAPAPASATTPPALAPEPAPAPVSPATIAPPPPLIDPSLDQAASLAANGQPDQARRVYLALLNAGNVSRATIAASAQGLYRLGDYAHAVEAFRNLGTFSRGEEDLRYYNAVSLFETGRYADAKKELACALPYIQITSDVARYRDKIQAMPSRQAMNR
jgi:tetratricopeptide (TPR) repeat protein